MSEARYAEWMTRGRNHQFARRPLDAMQCFRRASREWPRGIEARFHLGEVLWQLGRLDEAVASWQEAARLDARFLPASQALAEAALGMGDHATAREAARRVLERQSSNGRALAAEAIASLALDGADAAPRVRAALRVDPAWLAVPALGGSLAMALDRVPDAGLVGDVFAAVRAFDPATLHARLHAVVAEHAAALGDDAWCAAMATRALAVDDHDALRRAAAAAARASLPSASRLAALYATLCETAFRPAVRLLWPVRTAGPRARLVVLARADDVDALAQADGLAARADVVVATIGPGVADAPPRALPVVDLGAAPALHDARRLATLDADLLLDLVGLGAASGPLLAARPARRLVTPATLALRNAAPLVDAVVPGRAAFDEEIARAAAAPSSPASLADVDAAWQRAVAAHQSGERDAAARGYAEVLAWQPGHGPALYLQAVLAREAGDLAAARAGFAAVLATAPEHDDARIGALAAAEAAHDAEAVLALSTPVRTTAAPELLRACGLAWLRIGEPARAEPFFVAALERAPSDAPTHYNHGVALQSQRRFDEAARAYQRALVCDPGLVAADFNLGVIFTELGNRDAAIAAFRAVLARDATHVGAHRNLAEALLAAGRIDEWLSAFRQFEKACPDALPLAVQAIEACHYAGDFAGVERYLEGLRQERFVAADPAELADALEQLLYLLLYVDVEPQIVRRFAETYAATVEQVYGPPLPRRAERTPGRVRIGYLSADLRNHVMGKMMYQAISRHDRATFDVRLYAMSAVRDEWTERFVSATDAFVPLAALDDAAAIARIAADDLDVLVDLNTHTRGSRPALLAAKPARVQVTHVASAGTLGMRTIDFKLTDRFADIPENQDGQLEPLLPMEGCVYPYRPIAAAVDTAYRRDALGIAPDAYVIGAFVNPLKLSRRTLTLWRDVLARVPRAVIACSPLDAALRDVYRRVARAGGLDPARLVFVPAGTDEATNQARYAVVDVVLDPMPFGGVNGTLEALDAGVPVVTLVGRRHGERTSYSILANLGVTQTVATTGREYVELAVRLADDPSFAATVRAAIARGLASSPLTDLAAHTRHLEAAYLAALRQVAPDAAPAP